MPVKDDFLVRQCMTVSHRIHSPGHKQHRLVLLLRNSLARVLMGRPHTASHTQREILKLLWMGGLRSLLRLSITSSHAPTGNLTFVSSPPVPPRCFAYLSRPPAPALALALPRMKVVDRRRHSDQTRFAPQAHGRPSTELNHARRCEAGASTSGSSYAFSQIFRSYFGSSAHSPPGYSSSSSPSYSPHIPSYFAG